MNGFVRELKFAFRALRKQPGFAAVVILTLGLGIGANTAIFSLLDQVLLRRLPVHDPGRLVLLDGPGPFQGRTMNRQTFSYPMYRDFRDRTQVFSGVLARMPVALTMSWNGESERVAGELVTGNFFDVLGVRPALGRVLTAADDQTRGGQPVVVLGYGFWKRRFGADPSILNQVIALNGHPMTVVGVSAAGFTGVQVGAPPDVMVPVMMKAEMTPTWDDLDNRRSRWLTVMARLKPGVSREQAEAQMNVVYRQILEQEASEFPQTVSQNFRQRFVNKHLDVLPGGRGISDLRAQFTTPLVVLMWMVGVVLLIACANIANLLLVRTAARQREVSIRLALGAGRRRIVSQQLAESLLLAVAGAAIGLLAASWLGGFLLAALPGGTTGSGLNAGPDGRVVAFALVLSLATAVLFSIMPSLHATRASVAGAMKEEAGSVAGGGRQARMRRVLVVCQVGLSMVLLAGATLFARSLYNLRSVDPGFEVDHLIAFSVDPSLSGYTGARSRALFQRMQDELSALPGVRRVSMAELGPLTGNDWSMTIRVEGYAAKENENLNPNVDAVGPGYFSTMGVPLVAGREFSERDDADAPRVAVVNETMAKYFFGTGSAIGHRFVFGRDKTDVEIVGVVRDTRTLDLRSEPVRFVYIPYKQDPDLGSLTFYTRAAAGTPSPATAIRQAVQRIDPSLPMYDVKTMDAQVDESLFIERMVAALSAAFGGLATLLAAIGLYGVISFAVTRRTREIGIRIALGAERSRVLWLIMREAAVMACLGIGIGLTGAFVLVRYVQAQLYGLSATDPRMLGAAAIVLAAVALLAGYVPARRAMRIDPMRALRAE